MRIHEIRDYLLPGAAEQDPGFRAEVLRIAHLSLTLIGGLELAIPLLMLLAGLNVVAVRVDQDGSLLPSLAVFLLGALTLTVSRTAWSRPRARLLAALSVWLNSVLLSYCGLQAMQVLWSEQYMIGYILLVMLGAVAAIPLQPLQTLALGLSINASYLVCWLNMRDPETTYGALQHVFTLAIALVSAPLTAVVYRYRISAYQTQQQALRASEELGRAQCRLLLSENAAAMGRLAAALSHELNSPIGALISAVDTLIALLDRHASASPPERERLAGIIAEARSSLRDSAQRLREIVARMQRFTHLDKAEVQPANLNELLSDVVALLEPQSRGKVQIALELQPLPDLNCRPQQLSAVFSSLLANSLEAVEAHGRVTVSTRRLDSHIEVRIADNGRGIPPEILACIFDPGTYRLSGTRLATGNWSLFSARQIVREHGGEITLSSTPHEGTTATVTLPC